MKIGNYLKFLVIFAIFFKYLIVILKDSKKELGNQRRVGENLDICESFGKIKESEAFGL